MATTKDTPETTLAPVESLSYEQACRELIETVRMLEAGNTGLEEALTLWERGEELAGHCQAFLDRAQQRISARVDSQEDAEPETSDTDQ